MPPTEETKVPDTTTATATNSTASAPSKPTTMQNAVAEQKVNQDAFDEAFAPTPKKKEAVKENKAQKPVKDEANKEAPKKESGDEQPDTTTNADDSKNKKKEEQLKVKSAQDKLDERANQLEGGNPTETTATPAKTQEKPIATAPETVQKLDNAKILELSPETAKKIRDQLASGTMKIGDTEVDIRQFSEDYPEEFNVITAVGMQAGKQMAEALIEKIMGDVVGKQDIADIRQEMAHRSFMEEVMRSHADVHEVIKSDGFKAWMGKQAPGVRKLESSSDPADAKFILDAYKESIGKAKDEQRRAQEQVDKNTRDSLYEDTNTTGSGKQKPSTEDNKNDFGAGFDEAAQ